MRFGVTLGGGAESCIPPWGWRRPPGFGPFSPPWGGLGPFPIPAVGWGVPSASVTPGGVSLVTPFPAALCMQAGPGCSPHAWLGTPCAPTHPPWGWGVKNRFAPVPRGLPGPLHIRGDAGSMAGEGFPLSRLAAASIEPWKSWVFGEHRCLPTLGMSRSPQPHGPQWGCWHLGTEYPWQPFPTWLLRPFPVTVHHPRVDFPASTSPASTAGAFALPALLPYISPSPFTRKYWPACSSWQPHLQWNCIRHLH